jgi:NADPH-dependent 2,4-dienoyl-CoA reductase/sulfur reductase-like enzyme/nitrite reductase/ring-hydroxylating ferredoxin subunit
MDAAPKTDFKTGVPIGAVPDGGLLAGSVGGEDALLIRRGAEWYAVGAFCTHYHGPLAQGLIVGDTLRCPLHHACFSLSTGEALRAPAFDPIACWRVERIGDTVFAREKLSTAAPDSSVNRAAAAAASRRSPSALRRVVIVGGGGAGLAAADALRRRGYEGALTMISADDSPPCDRPNLSKDFLAGTAPPEWILLRPAEFYSERNIDLVLQSRVSAVDIARRRVEIESGRQFEFDALLLATGAEPVRLDIPGAAADQVCYLRTFADSRAIVAKAAAAHSVVVVGASFIGLEAAASLRARGIEVHVVAPEKVPMARILGEPAGQYIQALHESHGVLFHLGNSVGRVDGRRVTLRDGSIIDADFLVLGAGVRPSVALAEKAGLNIDRGVTVNEYLETGAPGVFAAGDIARWPDPHSGERIRVEHWVVAERQGQVAAMNMLGWGEKFDAVPFFWSQHYDLTINYVGHAEQWDAAEVDGSFAAHDFSISFRRAGRVLAVATAARDAMSLRAELTMEAATQMSARNPW